MFIFKKYAKKKKKKYNLIIIGLIFFIPIIIHIAYSLYVNKIISSKWLAGDILLYCATILSAFVAWFSSHSTLEKTQRNNAKPYIAIEKLLYSKKNDLQSFFKEDKELIEKEKMYEFKEYSLYQVNLIIDNPPLFTEKLTDEQKQMIMTNGNVVKIKDNIISVLYNDRFCYLPLLIRNVGTGCAINMNIGLRKVEANHKFQFVPYIDKNNVSAYRLYAPFTCNKDEKLTLRLITDNPKQNINGIYELFFEYKDIFNDCYKQSIKLVIENDYIIKVYYDYE